MRPVNFYRPARSRGRSTIVGVLAGVAAFALLASACAGTVDTDDTSLSRLSAGTGISALGITAATPIASGFLLDDVSIGSANAIPTLSPEASREYVRWQARTTGLEPLELLSQVPFREAGSTGDAPVALIDARELLPTATGEDLVEAHRQVQITRYAVPEHEGEGQRIVYSNKMQRVWLIEDDGSVRDTYLISGRRGEPKAGSYRVFSKSVNAVGGDGTLGITMKYMVRFTRSTRSNLPIGFHSIPRDRDGNLMQTRDELGLYRSGGCIRQPLEMARALYEWAPIGMPVIVVR